MGPQKLKQFCTAQETPSRRTKSTQRGSRYSPAALQTADTLSRACQETTHQEIKLPTNKWAKSMSTFQEEKHKWEVTIFKVFSICRYLVICYKEKPLWWEVALHLSVGIRRKFKPSKKFCWSSQVAVVDSFLMPTSNTFIYILPCI